MPDKVAVIGLGLMGSAMFARLIEHGFEVRGYHPDQRRVAEFEQRGGVPTTSPSNGGRNMG